jgi:hypothetical protein
MLPGGERLTAVARGDRQEHGEVAGGLGEAHAADDVDEDVLVEDEEAGVAVEHGHEHGEADGVDADAGAARVAEAGGEQGLDLEQQRA